MPKEKLSDVLGEKSFGKQMDKTYSKLFRTFLKKWERQGIDCNDLFDEEIYSQNQTTAAEDVEPNLPTDFFYGIKQELLTELNQATGFLKAAESRPLVKLQVTVSEGTHHLLASWSAAEGQPMTSCLRLALEKGLRQMKKDGEIPISACESYEEQCKKRMMCADLDVAINMMCCSGFDFTPNKKEENS